MFLVWVRPEPHKWVRGAQYPFVVLGESHPGHNPLPTACLSADRAGRPDPRLRHLRVSYVAPKLRGSYLPLRGIVRNCKFKIQKSPPSAETCNFSSKGGSASGGDFCLLSFEFL
jgi:hypothetical protein